MNPTIRMSLVVALFASVGCGSPSTSTSGAPAPSASSPVAASSHEMHGMHGHHGAMPTPDASNAGAQTDIDLALHRVAAVHGDAGPWAVAGFRMGKYALKKLDLSSYSFDLEIVHSSPKLPQFACVADGASAATGASIGKLNLTLADADEQHVQTLYRKKSTGASVTLKPSSAFIARYRDLPRDKLRDAGREVMTLQDSEVFDELR